MNSFNHHDYSLTFNPFEQKAFNSTISHHAANNVNGKS